MKISIVLPSRNEEMLIRSAVKNIVDFLSKRKIIDYEILIVINGTTDKSRIIVGKLGDENKKIKVCESKPGYGHALKKGLRKAKGDYVAIFNVDFYDLRMLDLVSIDLYGKDFIIGSKMAHWSEDKRSLLRRVISLLFNLFLKVFFGFVGSDTHGIKLMKKVVVDRVLPKCKTESGIFDTEFVLKAQRLGYKFADFPVSVEEKRPPRFKQRLFQTPMDVYNLAKALKNDKK